MWFQLLMSRSENCAFIILNCIRQFVCSPADYKFWGDKFLTGVICSAFVKCPAQQAPRNSFIIDNIAPSWYFMSVDA